MTDEDANEILDDMRGELSAIKGLESIRVVRKGALGAEKGSVFGVFATQEQCSLAKEKLHGKVYDSRKI